MVIEGKANESEKKRGGKESWLVGWFLNVLVNY